MIKIDAHQHFWEFDAIRDAWIDDSMQVIRKDFLPDDLQPTLSINGIAGCVAVQADQSEKETNFLLDLASKNDFIKGVVGWVDLVTEDIEERLSHFSSNKLLKGVRHIAQGEADDFLLRDDFQRGISHLETYGLTYDLLVYAHQLPAAIQLAKKFPNQKFVLDHIAKPKISEGLDVGWSSNIKSLAECPNVYCKLSGMVTETTNFEWEKKIFHPFMELVTEAFGINRIMYGSDWPVCLLAANYEEQLEIVESYINTYSATEQDRIMGANAIDFYDLSSELI